MGVAQNRAKAEDGKKMGDIFKLVCALVSVATTAVSQRVDDFSCPDEFVGYYPHLISCDKYWHCQDGIAELKTCGNGLGFLDTDESFTLEQCAELHLVECGERTEIEPPISTEHCPRLYGTYADDEDCGIFWVCMDGKANRYECPPGLAYDKTTRGCRWADQVAECSSSAITVDEEGSEFQCPKQSAPGIFTKHAHPADCRQYFLCIGGVPREYGCPLGTVFNVGSGTGGDGECSDPEEVPECKDYYGDLKFESNELSRNRFNSQEKENPGRQRSGVGRPRNQNSIQRSSPKKEDTPVREVSRPAPPALQAVVNSGEETDNVRATLPPRLSPVRIQSIATTTEAQTTQRIQRPSRLEVLTDRPSLRKPFRQPETSPSLAKTTLASRPGSSRFNSANRFSFGNNRLKPTLPPSTTTTTRSTTQAPASPSGLPDPKPAAPGPNGEEYYYYYYYYDDEDAESI